MLKLALNAGMVKSLTRQVMQVVGVGLVAKGVADADQVAAIATSAEVIAGGVSSLASVLWSIKKERRPAAV